MTIISYALHQSNAHNIITIYGSSLWCFVILHTVLSRRTKCCEITREKRDSLHLERVFLIGKDVLSMLKCFSFKKFFFYTFPVVVFLFESKSDTVVFFSSR